MFLFLDTQPLNTLQSVLPLWTNHTSHGLNTTDLEWNLTENGTENTNFNLAQTCDTTIVSCLVIVRTIVGTYMVWLLGQNFMIATCSAIGMKLQLNFVPTDPIVAPLYRRSMSLPLTLLISVIPAAVAHVITVGCFHPATAQHDSSIEILAILLTVAITLWMLIHPSSIAPHPNDFWFWKGQFWLFNIETNVLTKYQSSS
jgi:hypothetical protein